VSIGRLDQRVAIVTGGARGIGLAVAKILCEFGATSVIADINYDQGLKSSEKLNEKGYATSAVKLDVSSPESISENIELIYEKYGRIDILVNNAGILDSTSIPELTVEAWDHLLDIDLRGVHLCSQAVLPYMKKSDCGRIINLSSQAGQLGGWKAGVNYSAAKGGVLALTKAYARYAAKFGITVNAVSPGFILTDMTASRSDETTGIPLGRLGTAEDVANSVYFLASDLSSYITGFTIDVNGGYFIH